MNQQIFCRMKKTINSIKDIDEIKHFIKKHKRLVDTGKLAEFWCEKLCGITLAKKSNEKGYDGITSSGEKIEIKYRYLKGKVPPGMKIDTAKIKYVYYVFMNEDLLPDSIYRYNIKHIQQKENSRVSFKNAHKKGQFEIIYSSK